MDEQQTFRVGLIGASSIVEAMHLPVLLSMKNVAISWVFDLNPTRSKVLSKMSGAPFVTDWKKSLAEIDVCLLTVPYGVRQEYISEVAMQKKALYVEKPFALSIEQHDSLMSCFPPERVAVGFQRRFYKLMADLKCIQSSKIFGKLRSVSLRQGGFNIRAGSSYTSNAAMSGGGIVIESAIHMFDQVLVATGASDVTTSVVESVQFDGIDYETIANGSLLVDGIDVDYRAEVSTLRNLRNGITLVFDKVSVRCSMMPDASVSIHCSDMTDVNFDLVRQVGYSDCEYAKSTGYACYLFWDKFLQGLRDESANITSAVSSRLTSKWMEQIYNAISK